MGSAAPGPFLGCVLFPGLVQLVEELACAWMAVTQGLAISQAVNAGAARPPIERVLRLLNA
ncbi:hypothetical protein ATI61_101136 [Archangium gephyra]|uniref:Uncharacterized protein n=1 Tax=Archangium gephyra TaxID=48 RepID=A0ABX9KBF9_9BACT|nr:hypothetical protein ATI61_101136 [Archangium gephyra]